MPAGFSAAKKKDGVGLGLTLFSVKPRCLLCSKSVGSCFSDKVDLSLSRGNSLVIQRGMHRVPWERGAFHANRKLAHA
jgi:hypothetical protein